MLSHRSLRMAQAIREVVATAILFEVADPRIRSVDTAPKAKLFLRMVSFWYASRTL